MLVDFWTYSCINCLRTLPHLQAWYAAYHKDGLEIVGVHTPEFAFEHVLGNVEGAVHRLDVTWPVALDNSYGTWNAYANQYWPADYLVDKQGDVRARPLRRGRLQRHRAGHPHAARRSRRRRRTSEHDADRGDDARDVSRPAAARPHPLRRLGLATGKSKLYTAATVVPQDAISYGGEWALAGQIATAGIGAQLLLHFQAKDVYIVLGGKGRVTAQLGGKPLPTIDVNADRLYTVLSSRTARDGVLRLGFTPGVRAYSFTFG